MQWNIVKTLSLSTICFGAILAIFYWMTNDNNNNNNNDRLTAFDPGQPG